MTDPVTGKPCCPSSQSLPPMRYPAWMDAHYQSIASHPMVTVHALAGTATEWVVPGNPRRWAIGFFAVDIGSLSGKIRPEDFPPLSGFTPANQSPLLWLTAFEYGPLVSGAFYLSDSGVGQIAVVEIVLQ